MSDDELSMETEHDEFPVPGSKRKEPTRRTGNSSSNSSRSLHPLYLQQQQQLPDPFFQQAPHRQSNNRLNGLRLDWLAKHHQQQKSGPVPCNLRDNCHNSSQTQYYPTHRRGGGGLLLPEEGERKNAAGGRGEGGEEGSGNGSGPGSPSIIVHSYAGDLASIAPASTVAVVVEPASFNQHRRFHHHLHSRPSFLTHTGECGGREFGGREQEGQYRHRNHAVSPLTSPTVSEDSGGEEDIEREEGEGWGGRGQQRQEQEGLNTLQEQQHHKIQRQLRKRTCLGQEEALMKKEKAGEDMCVEDDDHNHGQQQLQQVITPSSLVMHAFGQGMTTTEIILMQQQQQQQQHHQQQQQQQQQCGFMLPHSWAMGEAGEREGGIEGGVAYNDLPTSNSGIEAYNNTNSQERIFPAAG